ncbi:MAG: DUF429 domain-containing protein [Parvularculaceae bacterium]
MPATKRRNRPPAYVLGIDGCRGGWAAVKLGFAGETGAFIAPDFAGLMAEAGRAAEAIMVDMPIGLADAGRRQCEKLARQKLTPGRTSSVFPSPRRPMLAFATYAEANAWGKAQGCGLSKQAWMIAPKIREIDDAITPADQARLGEAHPEVAFTRLNGGRPCAHSKRTREGEAERLALLACGGIENAEDLFAELKAAHGGMIGRDDVYDACALALTARARIDGTAWRLTDGARDARGLVMEIWG